MLCSHHPSLNPFHLIKWKLYKIPPSPSPRQPPSYRLAKRFVEGFFPKNVKVSSSELFGQPNAFCLYDFWLLLRTSYQWSHVIFICFFVTNLFHCASRPQGSSVLQQVSESPSFLRPSSSLSSEKAMVPHSSTLAWKIPWTEEPGGLQSMGSLKSRTRLSDFTFHFHALEKDMATHSSVLAWRIPGMGEPGGLPSMGSHRVGHDWSDAAAAAAVFYHTDMPHFAYPSIQQWTLGFLACWSYCEQYCCMNAGGRISHQDAAFSFGRYLSGSGTAGPVVVLLSRELHSGAFPPVMNGVPFLHILTSTCSVLLVC